jgi:hypothetical protein
MFELVEIAENKDFRNRIFPIIWKDADIYENMTTAYMKTHNAPSEAQIAYHEHWRESSARAQQALEDPARRAFYETIAQQRDVTTYLAAFVDFLVEPTFSPLDLSEYKGNVGDKISVLAKDDIGLANVEVTLTTADGTMIEQGPAIEDGVHSGKWIYTATVPVPLGSDIFVEARGVDHAGNKTVVSANPIVGTNE